LQNELNDATKPQHAAAAASEHAEQSDRDAASSEEEGPGLIDGLRGAAANLFGLFISRIELAALELSEVRTHAARLMLIFAFAIVAVWFALLYWSALVVYLAWHSLGWKILAIVAAVFTLLAIGLFRHARTLLAQGKLSMPATLSELRNDRDALL